MQRRDFVRSALLGSAAAVSLTLPSAYAALTARDRPRLHVALARLDGEGAQSRWRALEACAGDACNGTQRLRVSVDALAFPDGFRGVSIDALFDTHDGLRPFRIGSHAPGSLSPTSKPVAFEVDGTALAGFRTEFGGSAMAPPAIVGAPLLTGIHRALTPGHYLMVLQEGSAPIDIQSLPVPTVASDAIVAPHAAVKRYAWLRFSVHASLA